MQRLERLRRLGPEIGHGLILPRERLHPFVFEQFDSLQSFGLLKLVDVIRIIEDEDATTSGADGMVNVPSGYETELSVGSTVWGQEGTEIAFMVGMCHNGFTAVSAMFPSGRHCWMGNEAKLLVAVLANIIHPSDTSGQKTSS